MEEHKENTLIWKAILINPKSNGEMDKLTITYHMTHIGCFVTVAIISDTLESQGQGRIDCLVLPSTLMDMSLIKMSNKSISYTPSNFGSLLGELI